MALTSQHTSKGAGVTAAVAALALGGVAVSILAPSASAADSRPTPREPAAASATAITVTGKADSSTVTDDTVFTISGEVKGAKPGTKIRLQRQQAPRSAYSTPAWTTLAYTTFTDQSNKFSLQVKMESSGTYNLRVLHPQDTDGPQTAYSNPFSVTVSAAPGSGGSQPS